MLKNIIKNIFLSFLIVFIISSTAFAFFENRYFPGRDVKDYCNRKVYGDGRLSGLTQDSRSDHTKKMQYQNCINDWYK